MPTASIITPGILKKVIVGYRYRTTLKQGTANENAANVGSNKGSDQRENDK